MIIDYDKVAASGLTVVELEENIHFIEDFIPADDADFLVSLGNSMTQEQWSAGYLCNLKMQAKQQFNTDDLDSLIASGKISINEYSLDKVVGLRGDMMAPPGVDLDLLNRGLDICNRATRKLNSFITDKNTYELSPFYSMRRHYPTDGMPDHNDQQNSPKQRQSAVIYLNDDSNGGELYFRDQKIELKPKAYSIGIFNNGADYMHGVRTVLDGPTRYSLATFISVK